ncbi:hypothetical protein QTO34_008855 [Cnephaeus nilssonii]|uniref:Uncharacterized protein n=1 Tax=Cnephaeus nilssonii TaxID=3371016 RepID=A0AA40LGQ9_CNENI|nr:hypothetical protein QTO34_008855 [Eptesicus nilssonii]
MTIWTSFRATFRTKPGLRGPAKAAGADHLQNHLLEAHLLWVQLWVLLLPALLPPNLLPPLLCEQLLPALLL